MVSFSVVWWARPIRNSTCSGHLAFLFPAPGEGILFFPKRRNYCSICACGRKWEVHPRHRSLAKSALLYAAAIQTRPPVAPPSTTGRLRSRMPSEILRLESVIPYALLPSRRWMVDVERTAELLLDREMRLNR
jgi:hypothetical protein